jgi:hypothetical protein
MHRHAVRLPGDVPPLREVVSGPVGRFRNRNRITVHALEPGLRIVEIIAPYKERPEGSVSKLHTYRDGIRILKLILLLLKAERPFRFFAAISAAVFLITAALAAPLVVT